MIRSVVVGAVLIWLALSVPVPVGACMCSYIDPSACVAAATADAVFVAEVVERSEVESSGRGSQVRYSRTRNRMRVAEVFWGDVGASVDVDTTSLGMSCGYGLEVGVPYVVYAYRGEDGRLGTGMCTRTHRVASDKGDLAYLRATARLPVSSQGSIVGTILRARGSGAFGGVRVVAKAGPRRYETRTDRNGDYTLGVPRGSYEVSYAVGDGWYAPSARVKIERGGTCAGLQTRVLPDGHLTGRVVDSNGAPVGHLTVSLAYVQSGAATSPTGGHAVTDAGGVFKLGRVDPGRFRVVIGHGSGERDDTRRVFHPGVVDRARATMFSLALGERKTLPDLAVPANVGLLTVSGTVRSTSGAPVSDATVLLIEPQPDYSPIPDRQVTPAVRTDGTGRFAIAALAGRYELWAAIPSDDGGGAMHVRLKQSTGKLSVTLTLPD